MNDRDLTYFCKLVETGSYTATANSFGVTQPTISTAVKRLQLQYGDALVKQKNRKSQLELTPAGKVLYQKAQKLIKELASLNYDVKHASDHKLRIGFSGIAGTIYIPEVIKRFYQQGFLSMLETKYESSSIALKDLSVDNVDVALFSWLVPFNDPAYYLKTLRKSELVLIVPKSDPLAQEKTVGTQAIKDREFVARGERYMTREALERLGELGEFTPKVIYTARTMKLVIDLVAKGIGIALVVEDTVKDDPDVAVIHLNDDEKLWCYMQMAIRSDFMPNTYQKQGIDILKSIE